MVVRCSVAIALALAAVTMAVSCDSDDDDAGGSPSADPPSTVGPTSTVVVSPPMLPCPSQYDIGLSLGTDDADEIEFLNDIAACTDATNAVTYVRNESDVVWTLATTTGVPADVNVLEWGERAQSFAAAMAELYPHALLLPGSSIVVHAPPSQTEWTLHPQYSIAWLVHDQFLDTVADYGTAQLAEAVAGPSLRRQAVSTCVVAVAGFVDEDLDGVAGDNPSGQLFGWLGAAGGAGGCARAWQEADEEAFRKFGTAPTWGDDVARWVDDSRFITAFDDQVPLLRRIGRALILVS